VSCYFVSFLILRLMLHYFWCVSGWRKSCFFSKTYLFTTQSVISSTLSEKVFLFSFGFRSITEKVSVKNVTFSRTNHDFFQKKEYFFSNNEHFRLHIMTSLAPLWYWTWIGSFFVLLFYASICWCLWYLLFLAVFKVLHSSDQGRTDHITRWEKVPKQSASWPFFSIRLNSWIKNISNSLIAFLAVFRLFWGCTYTHISTYIQNINVYQYQCVAGHLVACHLVTWSIWRVVF
jgi:hypothetical protein